MTQKESILQELSELKSTLATINPQNVYTVPVGYFEELPAQVLNRIKAMETVDTIEELCFLSPMLKGISKQMPYSIPARYFEELAEKTMKSVRESHDYLQGESLGQTAKEELETLSPLLSGLKKQMPYTVPEGYFETMPTGRQAQTERINIEENKLSAKVISITSRKWLRYAAAVVITGLIAFAGFLYSGEEKETGGKSLITFTHDVKKMNETQKDNLIDFIDAGMNGDETTQVATDNKSDEVKNLLQGISDKELKDFQEQTEDIGDVLMTN